MAIRIERLQFGDHVLESQNFSPIHKQTAEQSLSRIFSKQKIPTESEEVPFHLRVWQGGSALRVGNGKEIYLKRDSELKQIERLARFYQHTGQLERAKMNPQDEAFRTHVAGKLIRMVHEASVPGTNGQLLAGMGISQDTLSLTRNILYAIPAMGMKGVVDHLGYYAGMFWSFFAFRELNEGWAEYKRAKGVSDAEGRRRAEIRLLSGAICSTASVSYLAGRVCDTFSSPMGAAAAIGIANVLFGVGALIAMGASFLGALRCVRFNERINAYLEHPNLTEIQKMQGALQFLKDAVSVTVEEKEELAERIEKEHSDWSKDQKENLLQKTLTDLTEAKVKYLKRRTSNKSLYLILTQVDPLLAKLSDEKTQAEGIKEAAVLFHTIQRENKTKVVLHVLGLVAAAISFAAMLIMVFFTAGALPFVLYSIAGMIYLVTAVYCASGVFFKKDLQLLR